MHKERRLNQANVSITATRWCNRRCTHCYIDPKELANRAFMAPEVFRSVFDRMRELVALDKGLDEVEWELIGGEITSLPVEYWQENLPYALQQCRSFNRMLKTPGSINVLSNLIFSDERKREDYLALFNKYGDWPEMALYTSWEPDTNRFGKNMALFDAWKETVKAAKVQEKILDVILTKTTVALGPEYLLETFLPLGVTDFSIKMISPYGSGRSFWQPNMVEFKAMSDYLCRLFDIAPEGISFTPADEMSSAVFRGTSYQCIGNFRYDLAIEVDGLTTFNANQTTAEASVGDGLIYLSDPDWSWRVLADNTVELDNKLSRYHDYCFQCEFHSSCAGGWYHYRIAEPADVRAWDSGDCPGYKQLWSKVKARHGAYDRPTDVHRQALLQLAESVRRPPRTEAVSEAEAKGERFYKWLKACEQNSVVLASSMAFDKPLIERVWAYQAVGIPVSIPEAVFDDLDGREKRSVVEHLVFDDFHRVSMDKGVIWKWVAENPDDPLSRLLDQAGKACESQGFYGQSLVTADHNSELLRWVLANGRHDIATLDLADLHPAIAQAKSHIQQERSLAERLVARSAQNLAHAGTASGMDRQ